MTVRTAAALAVGASVLCLALGSGAMAQEVNDKPLEENWWPTEWGAGRQGRRAESDHARDGAWRRSVW